VSDHWHYSSDIHGGADQHHRHYDLEREDDSLRQEIGNLREAAQSLSSELAAAFTRIGELETRIASLEGDTPQARRLQYELDMTLADNAASGYRDDGEW
jgi:chromosome segregation ATPase